MNYEVIINVHSIIPVSCINGPGKRMVVFFQGCNNKCPGCFNPDTHAFVKKTGYSPKSLIGKYFRAGIEGLTVSGGEPFYQRRGLLQLLISAREDYGLSTVVYTGFSYERLSASPPARAILKYTDVLVDGRFEIAGKEPTMLARGSTNQRFHFLSDKYTEADFVMDGKIEMIIAPDGTITQTGFSKVA
ncbi:MAG: radical SAM protein [Nitrospirae bacterium]|nr:radical SAM protein [Nitrospirota bacterium]